MNSAAKTENFSLGFDNSYIKLPDKYYSKSRPVSVKAPKLIRYNSALASELGLPLDGAEENHLTSLFSGNTLFTDSEPIAMAYAGHQFGNFVPQLGDGRATLLGEIVNPEGNRFGIQLKGSGITKFSRNGDGRSALGPVIREYIISEAMHALGIPTTRALAMVTTGEHVLRQTGSIPGGVLTRVASGYVRVGTFEYFTGRKDVDGIRQLADYVIARHYPEAAESETPYKTLFEMICEAQAKLVPAWMHVGFIHGVMNTDNTSICGETIDYGPCAFMDHYDPNTVFSSIDMHGRYKFVNQGSIIAWNLSSLGNSLVPILAETEQKAREISHDVIDGFQKTFLENWRVGMNKKIGLNSLHGEDLDLLKDFLEIMPEQEADFTLSFRYLADDITKPSERFLSLFTDTTKLIPWVTRWQKRLELEDATPEILQNEMNRVNPVVIPRNHRVENAINKAEKELDFEETHKLIEVLKTPYSETPESAYYITPAKPEERILQTFCGT